MAKEKRWSDGLWRRAWLAPWGLILCLGAQSEWSGRSPAQAAGARSLHSAAGHGGEGGGAHQAEASSVQRTDAMASRAFGAEMVRGVFRVAKIGKTADGESYRIDFAPVGKTARESAFFLESVGVHAGLRLEAELSLTALLAPAASPAQPREAYQILVGLRRAHGLVPMWVVSRHQRSLQLGGAPYLEMHDPQSDFLIL